MTKARYYWRPLSPNRLAVYAFITANPACTQTQIIAGTGLTTGKVRNALDKGIQDGEVLCDKSAGHHYYKYSIGTLLDRTPRGRNWQRRQRAEQRRLGLLEIAKPGPKPKPKTVKPKKSKAKKPKASVIKQTKPYQAPEKKVATVTWPEHVKVTVLPSYAYEPLNFSKHVIGRHV